MTNQVVVRIGNRRRHHHHHHRRNYGGQVGRGFYPGYFPPPFFPPFFPPPITPVTPTSAQLFTGVGVPPTVTPFAPLGTVNNPRVGDVYLDTLTGLFYGVPAVGAQYVVLPQNGGGLVTSGAGAPVALPTAAGQIYVDTTTPALYISQAIPGGFQYVLYPQP